MASLKTLQAVAEREARKLGVDAPIRVVFSGTISRTDLDKPCRLKARQWAHAHCYKSSPEYGTICIRRGLSDWRDTIKHEVAHFVSGGHDHGGRGRISGFVKARAKQGDKGAQLAMVRAGKKRCPKHEWRRDELLSQTMTSRGLVEVYSASCWKCYKRVG